MNFVHHTMALFLVVLWSIIPTKAQFSDGSFTSENIVLGKPLVIVNEDLHITISGKDNIPWAFEIIRKVRYRIVDAPGLEFFKDIRLPEDFDPTLISHAPAVKRLGVYYSAYKLESCDATIFREGFKPFPAKVKKKVEEHESFNVDYLYRYSQHHISVEGLQVGDEVELDYQVIIPFSDNYTRFANYRIYFHDDIPKLSYRLTLSHHETLDMELYQENGATTSRLRTENKFKHHIWDLEDLPACTDEAGSRPYLELPHLTWVLNHYKYFVHNETFLQDVPHYAIIASLRSPEILEVINAIQIGSTFQDYQPFVRKLQEMTADLPDDFNAVHHVHQHIVEHFKYSSDIEYYRRNDLRAERLGEFFVNGILRDRSRYNLYYAIFTKADLNFYQAFLIDKRCGIVGNNYFLPNFDNDFMLATYFGEKIMDFVLPKNGATGWYYNEIPFYWENTKARMVHVADYLAHKDPINERANEMITPEMPYRNNIRVLKAVVDVDLDMDSLRFSGQMRLSGQFSTMGRACYLGGQIDPTINPGYSHQFWAITPEVIAGEAQVSKVNSKIPFDVTVSNNYKLGGVLNRSEGEYQLDLRGWFEHIIPVDYDRPVRYLSYHPDFMGTEFFQYNLRFPRPVQVLDTGAVIKVETSLGIYELHVSQTDPNMIQVKSAITINRPNILAGNYSEVWKLFRAAERGNGFLLRLKE